MKKQIVSLILVCAVVLGLAGCCTSRQSTAWDYEMIAGGVSSNSMHPLQPQFQQAVADGWEVVSSGGDGSEGFVILRKRK